MIVRVVVVIFLRERFYLLFLHFASVVVMTFASVIVFLVLPLTVP